MKKPITFSIISVLLILSSCSFQNDSDIVIPESQLNVESMEDGTYTYTDDTGAELKKKVTIERD